MATPAPAWGEEETTVSAPVILVAQGLVVVMKTLPTLTAFVFLATLLEL